MNQTDKTTALLNYAHSLTSLKEYQGNLIGCCPVHSEKTPSFWVYPDKGHAHCFGCGFHGDALDLYQKVTGETFLEAKKALGFWDNDRPEPRVKKRVFPMETVFSGDNKREIYKLCAESLIEGHDLAVIMPDGLKIWNHEFIFICLDGVSDKQKYFDAIHSRLPPVKQDLLAWGWVEHLAKKNAE